MVRAKAPDWTLVAATPRDIEQLRERCRRLVRRRAMISAGVSALPIPGVAVMSDVSLFALLVDDINKAFGLTPEQIARLQPRFRLIAYEAAVGIGGVMVGKMVTRELVLQLFKRAGLKLFARSAARMVPLGGVGGDRIYHVPPARLPARGCLRGGCGRVAGRPSTVTSSRRIFTRPAAPRSRPAPPGCPGGRAKS
jgi:hypothetical protein